MTFANVAFNCQEQSADLLHTEDYHHFYYHTMDFEKESLKEERMVG